MPRTRNTKRLLFQYRHVTETFQGTLAVLKSVVSTEVDLILARASVFSLPRDIATWTICPPHCSSLGIGWRRGANRCRVPPGPSKHATKGKSGKADPGVGKVESKAILQHTRIFVPVGSGQYTFTCVCYCNKSFACWNNTF